MKTQQQWFEQYSQSHQNLTNKRIHNVAVPVIYWSVIALLWSVPVVSIVTVEINLAVLILLPVMVFYWRLSGNVFIRMALLSIFSCLVAELIHLSDLVLWKLAVAVFCTAWVLQFIGHKIEGARPSFFTDLVFLLIGPAWIVTGGKTNAEN